MKFANMSEEKCNIYDTHAAFTVDNPVVWCIIGPTERKILENVEAVIDESLPLAKLKDNFKNKTAQMYLVNKLSFYTERINVSTNQQCNKLIALCVDKVIQCIKYNQFTDCSVYTVLSIHSVLAMRLGALWVD